MCFFGSTMPGGNTVLLAEPFFEAFSKQTFDYPRAGRGECATYSPFGILVLSCTYTLMF